MNKNVELIKNTIIIFIGKFCTQFISFILIPIYTFFLNPSDYGYVDLIQTYMFLLVPIIILRFDSAIFRFLIDVRKNDQEKNKIISTSLTIIIIQALLAIILFIVFNSIFKIKYVVPMAINVIFMAFSSYFLQLTRGIGDNIGYSVASIISGITTITLNVVFLVILKCDGSSILYASAIANFICIIFLFFRNKIYKFINIKNVRKNKLKEMLKYSVPMISDGLSWWILNASDRTIISYLLNITLNGIYAVSCKFSNILSNLFQIFNMSWQESASLHINESDKDEFFSSVLNNTYKIIFSICLLIMVCMPIVFEIIIGKEYVQAYNYIPILLLGNVFNAVSNATGGVYIAMKNTKAVAKTTGMCAIINIFINVLLIKKIGLYAAALSTLLSYFVLAVYRYIDVQKYLKMKFNYKILTISIICFIFSCILYYKNNPVANSINIIFVLFFALIINKKAIIDFIKKRRI